MAPATRREARLSASLYEQGNNSAPGTPGNAAQDGRSGGPSARNTPTFLFPNVEHILENFEAFKRKHVAQNREIIRTNALAQLRIRELETKIESLQGEREEQALASIGLKAKISRLEHVVACVQTGWDVIGRSLSTLNGGLPTPDAARFDGLGLDLAAAGPQPELRSGSRISIDPTALPLGVVKSVAQAPGPHLVDLMEEEGDETKPANALNGMESCVSHPHATIDAHQADWTVARQDTPHLASTSGFASSNGYHLDRRESLFDVGGPPSPMSSPGLPMDLDDAIAAASRAGSTPEWRPNPPHLSNGGPGADEAELSAGLREALRGDKVQIARRTARRSSRRQSGLLSPPNLTEDESDVAIEPESAGQGGSGRRRDTTSPHEAPDAGVGDGSLVSPPLPLDQRTIAAPTLSASLMTTSSILREVTNGVKPSDQKREDVNAVDVKSGALQPTPRRTRRQKLEPSLIAKKASLEDMGSREPSTPGGVKRKMASHDVERPELPASLRASASPSMASDTSLATSSEADAAFGRTRRTRKSINYALPKLNTKMRKPDPVDLVPATPGSVASASRHATPSSSNRRVGSTGNLHDLRKQREARSNDERSADEPDDARPSGRRNGPDDEDGNAEGGTASLADLFETNPPRPRSTRKRTSQQSNSDSESASSATKRFWRTESHTDTSDDESRALSVSDVGDIAELESAMSALSTLEDDDPAAHDDDDDDYRPSGGSGGVSKSGSSGSIQSSSSFDGAEGRRPSLRRRSTTLPPRVSGAAKLPPNALGLTSTGSSDSIEPGLRQPREASDSSEASRRSPPGARSHTTPTQASSSRQTDSSEGATAKPAPQRTVTTRRLSAARLTAVTNRSSERPKSAGAGTSAGAQRSSSSGLSTAPNTSSPTTASASSSLGRSSGASASPMQRGGLHAALTNQPRGVGASTPQTLRPSASTSSLTTAASSSGRSSPALSITSTNSSGSHAALSSVRAAAGSTTSTLAKTTTTKQATMVAAAAAAAAAAAETAPPAAPGPSLSGSSAAAGSATPSARLGQAKPGPHPSRSMPSLKRAAAAGDATPRRGMRVASASQTTRPTSSGGPPTSTVASTPSSGMASSSAPRITVRSTASTSSISSERSTASSTATIRQSAYGAG